MKTFKVTLEVYHTGKDCLSKSTKYVTSYFFFDEKYAKDFIKASSKIFGFISAELEKL